jgi:KDO2-lipid IV(A) lauroyltransferase
MTSLLPKLLFRLLSFLPLRYLQRFGATLGRAIFAMSQPYAALTKDNLRQAQLARNEQEYAALLRQTAAEAGKSIAELPWIWCRPVGEVCAMVRRCDGWEHVETARAQGKGIIFLTPHWGCFEITSLYIGQRLPLTILYRSPKLAWLEHIMRAGRARGKVHLATADIGGVRLLFKALKRGEGIGLLPDQVPTKGEGEWVEFFSRPAYTMTLIGRLAKGSNASILMIYAERLGDGAGYNLNVEPLSVDFSKSVPRQINAALERVIAVSPSQYLWSYNRYKIPSGVATPTEQ